MFTLSQTFTDAYGYRYPPSPSPGPPGGGAFVTLSGDCAGAVPGAEPVEFVEATGQLRTVSGLCFDSNHLDASHEFKVGFYLM